MMESQRFYSYSHPTDVHAVRACLNDNALDLLAVGGENMVEVLQRVSVLLWISYHDP